jgi:predicted RNA-binding protein
MCLSAAYAIEEDGASTLLCEYVSAVSVEGDDITFTDITGEEVSARGSIQSVDLVKNTISVSLLKS